MSENKKTENKKSEIEAAVFRHLVSHLREHKEVQNIELMDLAGFCRNCLAKWYKKASSERGQEISYEQARKIIYGMDYERWKKLYQK